MRIVYGVHGFGRGHAMRSLAVAQRLAPRHELLMLAGSEAFEAFETVLPAARIPNIGFYYNRRGKISSYQTLKHNAPAFLDLHLAGATVDMVGDVLRDFRADLVISDSEPFTLAAARRAGVPRVLLDHFGILVYCRPDMAPLDRAICRGEALTYRLLYGRPEHVIVTAFFQAPPRREGVCVVGPIWREEVRGMEPSEGAHLLVYVSKGLYEYRAGLEQALQSAGCPVRVYGVSDTSRRCGSIEYRPFSNLGFLQDLATCKAVVATCGNQLCGELLRFGKPILGMPIACLEQRVNARYIERLGIGMQVPAAALDARVLDQFLQRWPEFKARLATLPVNDGTAQAVQEVERIASLPGRRLAAGSQPESVHVG